MKGVHNSQIPQELGLKFGIAHEYLPLESGKHSSQVFEVRVDRTHSDVLRTCSDGPVSSEPRVIATNGCSKQTRVNQVEKYSAEVQEHLF